MATSSSSSSDESYSSSSDESVVAIDGLRKRLQAALHRKDVEGAIEVIEDDELRMCRAEASAPPKGRRKPEQVSQLIDVEDKYGMTPLMIACQQGLDRMVLGLMLRGADTNFENQYGQTPLIIACAAGNAKVVKRLLFSSSQLIPAQISYKNRFGHDCFHYVEAKSRAKLLPLLNKAAATHSNPDDSISKVLMSAKSQSTYQDKLRVTFTAISSKNRKTMNRMKYLVLDALPSRRTVTIVSNAKKDKAARRIQQFLRSNLLRSRLKRIVMEARARRLWMKKATIAATNVQKVYRRLVATKRYKVDRERYIMATRIQSFWRSRIAHWRRRFSIAMVLQQLQEEKLKEDESRSNVEDAAANRRASALIAHTVKDFLRRFNANKKNQAQAALRIQRAFRYMRRKREKQFALFKRVKEDVLNKLKSCSETLLPKLSYCEVQEEILAATIINRFLRPYAKTCVKTTKHLRKHFAALCIQCFVRSFQARELAAFMKYRQHIHLQSIKECLRVKPLQPVRQAGFIAPSQMYGYCGKCPCQKFIRPKDYASTSHICSCGHHITGHVLLNYCASGDLQLPKVKSMEPSFYSSVGVVTKFEKDQWLQKQRSSRRQKKLLAPVQSPVDSLYNKAKLKDRVARQAKQESIAREKDVRAKVQKAWKAAEALEEKRLTSVRERRLERELLEQQRQVERAERDAKHAAIRKRERLLHEAKQQLIRKRYSIEEQRRKLMAAKRDNAELLYRRLRRDLLKPATTVPLSLHHAT